MPVFYLTCRMGVVLCVKGGRVHVCVCVGGGGGGQQRRGRTYACIQVLPESPL